MIRRHIPRLFSFGAIGIFGFIVDTAVLYLLVFGFGVGLYVSRIFSYIAAASTTWSLNRRYTFATYSGTNRAREWLRFLFFNLGGGIVNYGVYAALIATTDTVAQTPALGVAVGSIAGMFVNYTLSHTFVFSHHPHAKGK
jgi:putative flippase GtrA